VDEDGLQRLGLCQEHGLQLVQAPGPYTSHRSSEIGGEVFDGGRVLVASIVYERLGERQRHASALVARRVRDFCADLAVGRGGHLTDAASTDGLGYPMPI